MSTDLANPEYKSGNFSGLYESELVPELWRFMKRPDNVVRMETASFFRRPAVEPLSPGLLEAFGPEVGEDRFKQMIGHMARQIMEAMGYRIEQLERRLEELRQEERLLELEGTRLTRPERLSTLALEELGMAPPTLDQMVFLSSENVSLVRTGAAAEVGR